MVEALAKARSDVEILVEGFDEWVDDRIVDLSLMMGNPTVSGSKVSVKIDILLSARQNLHRIAEEIAND